MADNKTAHKWYKIVYSKGENSPNFEDNVQGTSAENAIQNLRYDKEKVLKKIKILYVWQSVDPSEYEEKPDWVRNVQYIRVEFPPIEDKQQEEETEQLAKCIQNYMDQRFIGYIYGPRDGSFTVCTDGFMRADHNFDNIELNGSCSNYPTRGTGENKP